MTKAVICGRGADLAPYGSLAFVIKVIVKGPGVTVAWWRAASRSTVPHGIDRRWSQGINFEFPQSVAVDGKPGKNGETSHENTKADDKTGEGARVLSSGPK